MHTLNTKLKVENQGNVSHWCNDLLAKDIQQVLKSFTLTKAVASGGAGDIQACSACSEEDKLR
jgi:uncharacterized FlgJ-related protein